MPITLNSNGNVSAVQFTITYDSNKLSLASISNAANLPTGTVIVNNSFTTGKINVVAHRPFDGTSVFPAGDVGLLRLNFSVIQGAIGNAAIAFSDAPTARLASDAQANAITLGSTPGNVAITTVYSVSGKVTNGGQGLANVTVYKRINFNETFTTTDAAGNYRFDDLMPNDTLTIRPLLSGYTFAPGSSTYTLNANVSNADFATSTVSYEGDIAGRPSGDGAVNVQDLVALGRIIATLDAQPALGSEWQRTDVAPRPSLGDGSINVQDLVQLGLYAANLDPLTPAGGAIFQPQQSSSVDENLSTDQLKNLGKQKHSDLSQISQLSNPADFLMMSGTATVKASSVTATSSTTVMVPIRLNSIGDTAAIQFSINYDSTKLSIASLNALVSRYPNTTFVFNNVMPGKLGVVAYQPLDGASVFPTGDITLFEINFAVVNNAGGTALISFGNDPTQQSASNPQAGVVNVSSSPGTVTFLGPTAASVTVGGRVLINGRGVINAIVTLTDQTGNIRTTHTNSLGYYSFANIAAGETYIFTAQCKKRYFNPQIVSVVEEIENLDFIVSEP